MPSFGGVELVAISKEWRDRYASECRPEEIADFSSPDWPGSALSLLPFPPRNHLWTRKAYADNLGGLWWPRDANRFAVYYGLATDRMVSQIRPLVYGPGGNQYNSLPFVMDDGDGGTIVTYLYWLPARPLSQHPGFNGMNLVCLVDDRHFYPQTGAVISVTEGTTTWHDLLVSIATALGIASFTPDTISSNYLLPTSAFAASYRNLPQLMDAACRCCGQRFVRFLDGKCVTQAPLTAKKSQDNQLTTWEKRKGGLFALDKAVRPNDLQGAVPSSVLVAFPKTLDGVPNGVDYPVTTTLTSLALPEFTGVTGTGAQQIFHSSAVAKYTSGVLQNGTALTNHAKQLATDFFRFSGLGRQFTRFIGSVPYVSEGLSDHIEWRHSEGDISTWVRRGPWDGGVDTVTAATSAGGSIIDIYDTFFIVNVTNNITLYVTQVTTYIQNVTYEQTVTYNNNVTYSTSVVNIYNYSQNITYGNATNVTNVTYANNVTSTYQSGSTVVLSAGSTLTLQGTVNISAGTWTFDTTVDVTGGTWTWTTATVDINSGTWNYATTVNITGGNWSWSGTGTFTFSAGGLVMGSTSSVSVRPSGYFVFPTISVTTLPTYTGSKGEALCNGKYLFQFDTAGGGTWNPYVPMDPTKYPPTQWGIWYTDSNGRLTQDATKFSYDGTTLTLDDAFLFDVPTGSTGVVEYNGVTQIEVSSGGLVFGTSTTSPTLANDEWGTYFDGSNHLHVLAKDGSGTSHDYDLATGSSGVTSTNGQVRGTPAQSATGSFADLTGATFTAPSAGTYLITAQVVISVGTSTADWISSKLRNSTTSTDLGEPADAGNTSGPAPYKATACLVTVSTLASSDVVKIQIQGTGTSAASVTAFVLAYVKLA